MATYYYIASETRVDRSFYDANKWTDVSGSTVPTSATPTATDSFVIGTSANPVGFANYPIHFAAATGATSLTIYGYVQIDLSGDLSAASATTLTLYNDVTFVLTGTNDQTVDFANVNVVGDYDVNFRLDKTAGTVAFSNVTANLDGFYSMPASVTVTIDSSATISILSERLQTPTGVAVTSLENGTATFAWNAVPHATGYSLEYAAKKNGTYATTNASVSGTTGTITGIQSGSFVFARVKAIGDGTGFVDSVVSQLVVADATVRAIPDLPYLAAVGKDAIVLWLNPIRDVQKYELQFSTDSGFANDVRRKVVEAGTVRISNLRAGTTYYFRVRENAGNWSNVVSQATFANDDKIHIVASFNDLNALLTGETLNGKTLAENDVIRFDSSLSGETLAIPDDFAEATLWSPTFPFVLDGATLTSKITLNCNNSNRTVKSRFFWNFSTSPVWLLSLNFKGANDITPISPKTFEDYAINDSAVVYNHGVLLLNDCEITNCVAYNTGGAICNNSYQTLAASGAKLFLSNCNFRDNRLIPISKSGTTSTEPNDNTHFSTLQGGAIKSGVSQGTVAATLTVVKSTFEDNLAASGTVVFNGAEKNWFSAAGAIFAHQTMLVIVDSTFTDNIATYRGGAVYALSSSSGRIERCVFSGNQNGCDGYPISTDQRLGGGALALYYQCSFDVLSCEFVGNATTATTAYSGGGAIWNAGSGSTTNRNFINFANCLFYDNSSANHGGAIHNNNAVVLFVNGTIVGNSATNRGCGVYSYATETTLTNSIVVENGAEDVYKSSGTFAISNALIKSLPSATANQPTIDAATTAVWNGTTYERNGSVVGTSIFADSANDDFRLANDSIGLNVGDCYNLYTETGKLTNVDLAGKNRVFGDDVDLGVYEFGAASPAEPSQPTTLPTPTSVLATPTTATSISLSWSPVVAASGYLIEYGTDSSFAASDSLFVPAQTSATLADLAASSTYYFRLTALGSDAYDDSPAATVGGTTETTTNSLPSVAAQEITPLNADATVNRDQIATFAARIVELGTTTPIDVASVTRISYSVYQCLLSCGRSVRTVVGGRRKLSVPLDSLKSALVSAACWSVDSTGCNFVHTPDVRSSSIFAEVGRYEVVYKIERSDANPIVLQFDVSVV